MSSVGSIDGIYISEDRKHTLTITNSVDRLASFSGSFISQNLSIGEINYDKITGDYAFSNDIKKWPSQVGFRSLSAFSPKSYVIADHWNGIRTADGTIIMSGLRTYATDAGLYDIHYFEKVVFTLTPIEA
ncbi:hypothetical protein [Xenorhabdus stockiae]|uniref:hypothetical protein n=1 Tax=Xenorhabdus stockiae TaxID=351614 RepID=UPI004064843A